MAGLRSENTPPQPCERVFEEIVRRSKEYSKMDPELEKIVRKRGFPKSLIPQASNMAPSRRIAAGSTARFMASSFVRSTLASLPNPSMTINDRQITGRDGSTITIRIYHPSPPLQEPLPVVVNAHGGGFCLGGLDTDTFICQLVCRAVGVIVIDVDYRLAPEVKLPSIINDVYDVLHWVAINAASFGGDPRKGFLTVGVSGGGNLTTATTYLARDNSLQPPLTGSVLVCTGMPTWTQDTKGNELNLFPGKLISWIEHKDLPVSGHEVSVSYGALADPDIFSPEFTPFLHQHHRNLPPIYYQACGMDTWRDSAILYKHLVEQDGGTVKLDMYPGLPHTFWAFYPQLSACEKWARELVKGVHWLLEQGEMRAPTARL